MTILSTYWLSWILKSDKTNCILDEEIQDFSPDGKAQEIRTGEILKNRKWQRRESPESQHVKTKHALIQTPTIRPRFFSGFAPTVHMFFLDMFFFLDSFPGDPHLVYVMPTREIEPRSPWTDRGNWGLQRALLGRVEESSVGYPKEKSGRANKHL